MKIKNARIKRFTALILSIMLAIEGILFCDFSINITEAAGKALPYTDISSYTKYITGIQYVYENDLLPGVSATKFNPGGKLTKADAVMMLWKLAGSPNVRVTGTYSDITKKDDCYLAAEWANAAGISVVGTDGKFKPASNIIRQDFAVMLMNFSSYLGIKTKAGNTTDYKTVSDYAKISKYAVPAMQWAYANKLMGIDSSFSPKNTISRANSAFLIKTLMDNTVVKKDDVINILMMGIDYNNYSDATILVTINKTDKTISYTSILRDMNLDYGKYGYLHYNNGFRYGSANLMKKMTEQTLNIKVDGYAFVHFDDMAKIFDLLGGLTIDKISEAEVEVANNYLTEMAGHYNTKKSTSINGSGKLKLTGYQLVAFCRVRYVGKGDRERTSRQRRVFSAMFEKFKTMSFPKLVTFFAKAMPYVSTNLPKETLDSLITMLPTLCTYKLQLGRIPEDGTFDFANEMSEITNIDVNKMRKYLYKMIYN